MNIQMDLLSTLHLVEDILYNSNPYEKGLYVRGSNVPYVRGETIKCHIGGVWTDLPLDDAVTRINNGEIEWVYENGNKSVKDLKVASRTFYPYNAVMMLSDAIVFTCIENMDEEARTVAFGKNEGLNPGKLLSHTKEAMDLSDVADFVNQSDMDDETKELIENGIVSGIDTGIVPHYLSSVSSIVEIVLVYLTDELPLTEKALTDKAYTQYVKQLRSGNNADFYTIIEEYSRSAFLSPEAKRIVVILESILKSIHSKITSIPNGVWFAELNLGGVIISFSDTVYGLKYRAEHF